MSVNPLPEWELGGEVTAVPGGTWPLASWGQAHRIEGQHGKEASCLSMVAIRRTLNSKVRKLKSLDSAWKLFKKL